MSMEEIREGGGGYFPELIGMRQRVLWQMRF